MLENLLIQKQSDQSDKVITCRYVKLDKLSPEYYNYVSIWELEIISPNGTNWCREPGAVATAIHSYPNQAPIGLIDGYIDASESHRWSSAVQVPPVNSTAWCQVDLGQLRTFSKINMASDGYYGQGVVNCDILVSNDGVSFRSIKSLRNLKWPYVPIARLQTVYEA